MKFIKHALIGIALYEAVKYILKREDCGFNLTSEGNPAVSAGHQPLRREEVDVVAGARQTDQLERMKKNATSASGSEGVAGQSGLTKPGSGDEDDDPWKNSLANDELRAPDS